MWLQNLKLDDRKSLSPIELLVLTTIKSQNFENATEVISRLNVDLPTYNAERGTIYPVLKRLEGAHLLERGEGKKMEFRRTPRGTSFLSSISKKILDQIDASTKYFHLLSTSMVEIDPSMAVDILISFKNKSDDLSAQIEKGIEMARKLIREDNWVEVPLDD